jgi:hypothetical protein
MARLKDMGTTLLVRSAAISLAIGIACVWPLASASETQTPGTARAVAVPAVPMEFGPVDLSAPLPAGDDAWVVFAVTRGGLGGSQTGTLVVDSTGRVTCANAAERCRERLAARALAPLTRAVASTYLLAWTGSLSTCSDCYRTLLVLRRRLPDGTVTTQTAFWDVTTQANVATDVRNVYAAMVEAAR